MLPVEARGVGAQEPFHPRHQIAPGSSPPPSGGQLRGTDHCYEPESGNQTAKYAKYAKGKGVKLTKSFTRWVNRFSSPTCSAFACFAYSAVQTAFSRMNPVASCRGGRARREKLFRA